MNKKHIVWYADDDEDDRELISEIFSAFEKVELILFNNGLELLSFLQNTDDDKAKPCLVILDMNMPILDGKETLVTLRKRTDFDDVPVILFTTSNQPREKEFAFKYNAGFISKPVVVSQLENIAEIFIDHCADDVKKSISKSLR